ncbi:MAG: glycosyltransferase [Planctomycetaceae bacterium]
MSVYLGQNAAPSVPTESVSLKDSDPSITRPAGERVRVDGKFFSRGDHRLRIQGVTYGPFAPDARGLQFPQAARLRADFDQMSANEVNAIRTYHVPPPELLEAADEAGKVVLIDVPWARHLCFLDSRRTQAEARSAVENAVRAGRDFPSVFAYSIGNEIPANIVRCGMPVRRVERFLSELADVAKQTDSGALVTYANYPSTEYLDLSSLDFVTFNVYLHDREVFRRYLHRLQNIVGNKPLLLGELGMDSMRHGELEQAEFLDGHLRETVLMGLAGGFVFSWTDDWYTGGFQIEDWAFGITDPSRFPKAACQSVREVYGASPVELLSQTPRVSVVVCTYNGGRTLEQCVRSLEDLDYPDFEIIVVDDGSTDNTAEILQQFSEIRIIRQPNRGLSAARNVGLDAASGSIVAYTDSDCFVDCDWLTLLVQQLEHSGASAVGGPNLTPDDGWLAGCVAASPGQPTHVLENDQVAEHIPGCNMAFRRDALLEIQGFDYQYKKAGDDVDICWRLQHAGHWITFAPGAFVWHHRRQSPRTYLRQQAGYGEAEALLRFKHPERFNLRGDGKWNGVMYGASSQGLHLDKSLIYRGTFGTGLFQCIYQPGPAHWAMLPSTLEWHLAIALCCLAIPLWPAAAAIAASLWFLSLLVAVLQGAQAELAPKCDGLFSRLVVSCLCYAQPLVRAWHRQRTRLFSYHRPMVNPQADSKSRQRPLVGSHAKEYWSDQGIERTELLGLVIARLHEERWTNSIDTGWENWDVEVLCRPWTILRITTAQEEHGGNRRLIRVRQQVRASGYTLSLWAFCVIVAILGSIFSAWPYIAAAGDYAWSGWRSTAAVCMLAGLRELSNRRRRIWG